MQVQLVSCGSQENRKVSVFLLLYLVQHHRLLPVEQHPLVVEQQHRLLMAALGTSLGGLPDSSTGAVHHSKVPRICIATQGGPHTPTTRRL